MDVCDVALRGNRAPPSIGFSPRPATAAVMSARGALRHGISHRRVLMCISSSSDAVELSSAVLAVVGIVYDTAYPPIY